MEKFAWVKTYAELAKKLRNFRHKQKELIEFLEDQKSLDITTIRTTDQDEKGKTIPLTEIDPFTFFANFNRQIKTETRIEIIRHLVSRWDIACPVPTDFPGVPVMHNQKARFFVYKKDRSPNDMDLFWTLFEEALDKKIQPKTFDAVLKLRNIHYNITMGLYWIAPDEYLNLDSVNRNYLAGKGIRVEKLTDYATYQEYMQKTRDLLKAPFYQISYDAWLASNPPDVPEGAGQAETTTKKIWLFAPGQGGEYWDEFYNAGIMAIGWDYLGDLREFSAKKAIAKAIQKHDNDNKSSKKNDATGCYSFCNEIQIGDIVYAKVGGTRIIGRGVITSDYNFENTRSYFKHVRKVRWEKKGEWNVSNANRFALKTLTDITPYKEFTTYLDSLLKDTVQKQLEKNPPYTLAQCAQDTGLPEAKIKKWCAAIERKGQAVFYGPPGTGKTFIADHIARYIIGDGNGFVELLQFHPAYAYEEFMQGIRPDIDEKGHLVFDLKPGRFMSFCKRAKLTEDPCVLIIDEINRANLSQVFGELMYLLEYRKKEIPLASGENFSIPANVRIIGTMNTADRSIALVDFALRRRFAFIELEPDYDLLSTFLVQRGFNATGLVALLREVNMKINDKNYALGISFFMTDDLQNKIEQIWRMEIETYLEEYFFTQPENAKIFSWEKIRARLKL